MLRALQLMTAVTLDAPGSCPWGDTKSSKSTRAAGQAPIVPLYPHSLLCSQCVSVPQRNASQLGCTCVCVCPHASVHISAQGVGSQRCCFPRCLAECCVQAAGWGQHPGPMERGRTLAIEGSGVFVCSTVPPCTLHTRRAPRANSPLTLCSQCLCTLSVHALLVHTRSVPALSLLPFLDVPLKMGEAHRQSLVMKPWLSSLLSRPTLCLRALCVCGEMWMG